MITFLRGTLTDKTTASVTIECHGVGYEALAPLTTIEKLPAVGDTVFLLTDFVVRPESQTLYGFITRFERDIFRRLIKVSGVGAKTAIVLMSAFPVAELLSALSDSDAERIARAPGIGKKTAERIIVDFRGSPLLENIAPTAAFVNNPGRDVEQALTGLGYKRSEITRALGLLSADTPEDSAARLRAALQILSRR